MAARPLVRTLLRDDSGVSATVVAITLSLLIIMAAFAVDIGYAYSVRRQLQSAADAAALAGCRELIADASDARVLAVAEEYALRNARPPADGLSMRTQPPDTEVGPDYVQVTVEKQAPAFFSRIMGHQNIPVAATARAEVAYLTGLRGVVPWAVPVIHASRIAVRVNGGPEVALTDMGGGVWRGAVPVPTTPQTSGYPVDVIAYNDQTAYPDGTSDYPDGVPEPIEGAARVLVLPPDSPIVDVSLDRYVATSGDGGDSVTLTVRTRGVDKNGKLTVRFDGKNLIMKPVAPDVWQIGLEVPTTKELKEIFAVDYIKIGNDTVAADALALLVRRPTYPIADIELDDYTNPGSAVQVTVRLNDYEYGVRYPLKVAGGGGEVGNFCAIDLGDIKHPPNWRQQDPDEYDVTTDPQYKPTTYSCYIEKPFPFVIHIGDTIWTYTGNDVGQTEKPLATRLAGDTLTFELWEALGRPPTKRIVYVPVMEKMQPTTGRTPLRVVSFAAFFIESTTSDKANAVIEGRFIEYASPSDAISDTPPDGLYIETVRLVTPQ